MRRGDEELDIVVDIAVDDKWGGLIDYQFSTKYRAPARFLAGSSWADYEVGGRGGKIGLTDEGQDLILEALALQFGHIFNPARDFYPDIPVSDTILYDTVGGEILIWKCGQ